MPVLKHGRVEENVWIVPAGRARDTFTRETPILVGLAEWKAARETLIAGFDRRAVRLENADSVEDILDDLDFIEAVILDFPKFNDGRAFSQARLLRERYGYRGEIRATGHVIQDQFLFLQRCGVDAVEVTDPALLDAWSRAHERFKGFYQPALAVPVAALENRIADASLSHGAAYSRVEPAVLASWAY